jgi:hypothetical protein
MSKRLLIFTAVFGPHCPLPTTFLQSIRQAGIQADIVVFRHCRDGKVEEELKSLYPETYVFAPMSYGILRIIRKAVVSTGLARHLTKLLRALWKRIPFLRGLIETIAPYLLGIMAIRFFVARAYLKKRRNEYSAVLLTDSRDVIFQSDPLDNFEGGLMVGEEPCLLKNEDFNRKWLNSIYSHSPQTLEALWPRKVICAGVTIGATAQIQSYLDQMCAEFIEQFPQLAYEGGGDQAIHNKILRLERHNLDLRVTDNSNGIIANLATSDLSEFEDDWSEGVRTKDGRMVSIVHQYDRHPKLTSTLLSRLGFNSVAVES